MQKLSIKNIGTDILFDVLGSVLIAAGVHNFGVFADLPMAGFTGVALIMYHLFGLPIGTGIVLLNIPVAILCYRYLGRMFFLKSIKSMIISSAFIDYVAPLFPVYEGDRLLAAICMGVLCGAGYAIIFMRGSSSGGTDFITMSIRKANPHITLGSITIAVDISVIAIASLVVFREVDGFIYGVIATYLMGTVIDRLLYGMNEGKTSLIITDKGMEVAELIDRATERGSTILTGKGYFTGQEKNVVLCACSSKEMFEIHKEVKRFDPKAFTIILESNEVVGEGFKQDLQDF